MTTVTYLWPRLNKVSSIAGLTALSGGLFLLRHLAGWLRIDFWLRRIARPALALGTSEKHGIALKVQRETAVLAFNGRTDLLYAAVWADGLRTRQWTYTG